MNDTIVFDLPPGADTIELLHGQLFLFASGGVSIEGPGADLLTLDASQNNDRIFEVFSDAAISGLRLTGGAASGDGGAIYAPASENELVLDGIVFEGNTAARGGALYSDTDVVLRDSVFTGNHSTSGGGGAIFTNRNLDIADAAFTGNTAAGDGGAIEISSPLSIPLLRVRNSTFESNAAGGDGGALAISYSSPHDALVVSSTFHDNTAAGDGGAVYADTTAWIAQSTLVGNHAGGGGGLALASGADVKLTRSIVLGNDDGAAAASNIDGLLDPESAYNLLGVGGAGGLTDGDPNGNLVVADNDPRVEPLDDNGGLTRTMLPSAGSPAINGGDTGGEIGGPVGSVYDQRGEGFRRPLQHEYA